MRPFPNNQIPSNLISPIAQKYKQYVPQPNVPNAAYGAFNYVTNSSAITDDTQFLIRVDQNLPGKRQTVREVFQRQRELLS